MTAGRESPDLTPYIVDVGGSSVTVAVSRQNSGESRVLVEGAERPAALIDIPGSPIRLLRLGDAVYEVLTERGEERGSYTVSLRGIRLSVEALDERARAIRSLRGKGGAAAQAGPEVLRARMPGLVSRVLVGQGDTVGAGDGLVVIEAMKMENELRAKAAGRVRSVRVTPGTAVEKGTVLIELE